MDPEQPKPRIAYLPLALLFLAGWVITAGLIYASHLGWYHEPNSNHHLVCGAVLLAATGLAWLGLGLICFLWLTDSSPWLKLGLSVLVLATLWVMAAGLGFFFFLLHLAP